MKMPATVRQRCTALLALLLAALGAATVPEPATAAASPFVTRSGGALTLHGKPFRFAGTNNYYLHYQSAVARDNVLDKAAASGFAVVRTWGWFDTGAADGSDPTAGSQNGVYLQYWDGSGHPKYNDGADGLERLDAVIARAAHDGLKLVIPFTNNWADFGGMDRYVAWAGLGHHDDFYTDARIRGWYRDYLAHLLERTNTITGVKYKNDPTIMTWELANEPRCVGSGGYPRSSGCDTGTITAWADEMSTFIRSVDSRHLISVGDEGFFADRPGGDDWTRNGGEGVDTVRLGRLKNIDVLSYHLYPDGWGKTADWGTQWIIEHARAARQLGKPVMLGEFGYRDKATRNTVYQRWTDAAWASGTNGALYWILSDRLDDGSLYGDYDGFTVYCPSPVCTTIGNFARRMRGTGRTFAPVADDDTGTTDFGTDVSVPATANDIAYLPARRVNPRTVDLDPGRGGRQVTITVPGGTFTARPDGTVGFSPAPGFAGRAVVAYTVRDDLGRTSNRAAVTVTVKPLPRPAETLFDFETGVQGWAPAAFDPGAGTTAVTTAFHADGGQGLRLTGTAGGWFGAPLPEPADLGTRAALSFASPSANGSFAVSFQTGPDSVWCQGDARPDPGRAGVFVLDLTAVAPGCPGLSDVRTVNLYIGGNQTQDIDAVTVS
ncbi:cellulase family glycosylhydrolase [Actinoplanes oblitus]|uniref:mannan endo-1,4-beta-mannosidase n=1 Tax=Actinoplanes oblitus TaxID=3040509 RepID=A0ABY8W6M8_9ACTN|nr:cellulase family glycosylhydrolase [Actinoplanes oblitus]WIM93499.1 cellulase family glycosylhydrolase [Actinoplanes oblitus]